METVEQLLEQPDEIDFPDAFKLEIYRLRRRVAELECMVRDKNDRIVRAIKTLDDELAMWRQLLHDDVKETYDGVRRRVARLEGSLARITDKGSKLSPPWEIPDKWRKSKPSP